MEEDTAMTRIIEGLVQDPKVGRADVAPPQDGVTKVRLYDTSGVHTRTARLTPLGRHGVEITWEDQ